MIRKLGKEGTETPRRGRAVGRVIQQLGQRLPHMAVARRALRLDHLRLTVGDDVHVADAGGAVEARGRHTASGEVTTVLADEPGLPSVDDDQARAAPVPRAVRTKLLEGRDPYGVRHLRSELLRQQRLPRARRDHEVLENRACLVAVQDHLSGEVVRRTVSEGSIQFLVRDVGGNHVREAVNGMPAGLAAAGRPQQVSQSAVAEDRTHLAYGPYLTLSREQDDIAPSDVLELPVVRRRRSPEPRSAVGVQGPQLLPLLRGEHAVITGVGEVDRPIHRVSPVASRARASVGRGNEDPHHALPFRL